MRRNRFLVVLTFVFLGSTTSSADDEPGIKLLTRRNPSLRSGIVSITQLVAVSGQFGDPSTETRRKVYFDRDRDLFRIDDVQQKLNGEGQRESAAEKTTVRIRTSTSAIIKHSKTIDLMRVEDFPETFDPLSVGLRSGTAMEGSRWSDFPAQFELLESMGGRVEVSVSEVDKSVKLVTIRGIYPPPIPRIAEGIYWFADDRDDVPIRYVSRELKRLEDGTLEPLVPNNIESEVSWELINGAYVPRNQTIVERIVNGSGEVVGEKNFALTFDWEMVNQEIEDLSLFSDVSLDIPKGSHDIVDSRSGTPIVIQNPRIPSAAMLGARNELLRVRRGGEPALKREKMSIFRRVIIIANGLVLMTFVVVLVLRSRRRSAADPSRGKSDGR